MAKVDKLTMTIEDEVVFLTDPDIEFVSLVKHGAIRTPFKVFKTEKEDFGMNKVLQSILVKNDLAEDQAAKALENMSKKNAKEYSSYTSYPQVSMERLEEDSIIMVKHEEIDGVFHILGDLKKDDKGRGTVELEVSEKEALDYATMDNVYCELYAMADIVGGALRQEGAEKEFRTSTILTAIDNFKSFAEAVLTNMSDEKWDTFVKAEDHPTLVADLIREVAEKQEGEEGKGEGEEEGKGEEENKGEEGKGEGEEEEDQGSAADLDADKLIQGFNEALNNFGENLIGALGKLEKSVSDKTEAIQEEVKAISNTTVAAKAEADEIAEKETKKNQVFSGMLFQKQ